MSRNRIKERLRPLVKEALSDYLKDTEQDVRALQSAHPQLDIVSDLPKEDNDWKSTRGVKTESYHKTVNFEPKESRKIWVQYQYAHAGSQVTAVVKTLVWKDGWVKKEEKVFHDGRSAEQYLNGLIKKYHLIKQLGEASTSAGAGPYMTPYAFADIGQGKDAKKKKIAQNAGYKMVEKKRIKEEVRVNIAKAGMLSESMKKYVIHAEIKFDDGSIYESKFTVTAEPTAKADHIKMIIARQMYTLLKKKVKDVKITSVSDD